MDKYNLNANSKLADNEKIKIKILSINSNVNKIPTLEKIEFEIKDGKCTLSTIINDGDTGNY